MATIGVMIEAQEGLDWEHWRRIAAESERLGFASLRCSDHCLSVAGVEGRRSLQTWIALALAAEWTDRIQIGPMVSPITFYMPAILARMALAVDELAGGRLILGVGAGWNQLEHEAMGVPFPSLRERFDMLEAGIARIRSVLGDHRIPILIGGGGEKRGLTIAAREASEWNLLGHDPDAYRARSAQLDERCREMGRDPSEIRRSLMASYLIGRDQDALEARALRLAEVLPSLQGQSAASIVSGLRDQTRWFVGSPEEITEQVRSFAAAGADLFMLQHYLLDDIEGLELLAGEVMPRLT
jgi:alkanesulfonate monooxygenase SsuD/methylene tetrahydromethanopterin reductase-like flavin-dependent oxidoreductase (luciferase family)